MIFDFVEYVNNIRYRRWDADNVGTRISKVFALQFVFGLYKNKSLWKVRGRLNTFRRRWIYRLRDLVGSELWFPTKTSLSPYDPDFDLKKFTHDFRRCMFCRPCVVHFPSKTGDAVKLRPCWKTHICPFCWANLTVAQYVYVKNAINKLVKRDSDLIAVCRVVREYVPAPGFDLKTGAKPEQIAQYTTKLRAALKKHKTQYDKLVKSKALQRGSLGALWRLVVIPADAGWHVEVRQFLVCRAGKKPPFVKAVGCTVMLSKSISLNNARLKVLEDFYNLFGSFCQYPIELLTGYNQLVAAYLNAAHDIRLISGTGALFKTGRALMQYMREYKAHAKAKKEARKRRKAAARLAAQDAGDSGAGEVRL